MSDATKTGDMTGTSAGNSAGERPRPPTRDLTGFNYNTAAELFLSRSRASKSRPKYKRFDTAAEAVRFVVEELPPAVLPGTYLLVEEVRFGVEEMRYLYESAGFPLSRAVEKA